MKNPDECLEEDWARLAAAPEFQGLIAAFPDKELGESMGNLLKQAYAKGYRDGGARALAELLIDYSFRKRSAE